MNPDTLTLFREVANRSSAEREDYYAQHQVSAALRGEVESLLQAGERTVDSFAGHLASAAVRALLEEPLTPAETPEAAPAPRPILQPATIGRYRVIRLLGRGGMSDVYLARDPMLERDIAVKLIAGELDDAVARRRLVREASAAGRLRHPNIVTIFDAGEFEGRPFIAMEYVAGDTLRSLIQRRVPMPLRRRLELIEHACAGLAHAHRAGVVHLDIKPDNMIVDESGVLKVLDFGIARVLSSESLATRHIVGTLRYMSPEQIAGDPLDHRSDIFSLGCALYELLTCLPAYTGSTREIVYRIAVGPVPRLRAVMPDIDPRLDDVVGRAMALEPDERYPDLDAFQAELARLRTELDPTGDRPLVMPDPRLVEQTHTISIPTSSTGFGSGPLRARAPHTLSARVGGRASLVAASIVAIATSAAVWFWPSRPAEAPPAVAAESMPATGAPATSEPGPAPTTSPADASPPPVPTIDSTEVWSRLTRDDRDGVIRLLRAAGIAGRDTPDGRLPYEVLDAVRKMVNQSRETANATPGAAATDFYRTAENRRAAATGLERGNPVGALTLLWDAMDLYGRAIVTARANTAAPAAAEARTPVERPSPTGTATPQASSPSTVAQAPPPPTGALPASGAPPQQPVIPQPQPQPAARTLPPPTESAERGATEAVRPRTDVERVLDALERYRAAFQARDVAQLTQIYPSLSAAQVRQLRESFDELTSYELEIQDPRVQVQGDGASARAVVVRRMVPRVGNPSAFETPTEFRLRRAGAGWVITALSAQ